MLPIGISDDGLVSTTLDKRRNGLEAAIRDVMGNELGLGGKLSLGMEELLSEDAEDINLAPIRQ